jgi:hypothetical protein
LPAVVTSTQEARLSQSGAAATTTVKRVRKIIDESKSGEVVVVAVVMRVGLRVEW